MFHKFNTMDLNSKRDKYGEQYQNHFLKQYELYLASAERISDRRENANRYFYTLNVGTIVSTGFLLNSDLEHSLIILALVFLSILGVIFSVIFWYLINSYKQLNSGKFKVLHKMEKELPAQPYVDEWVELGEGKDRKKYLPFSHIERIIPIIFGIIYCSSLIFLVNFFIFNVACN